MKNLMQIALALILSSIVLIAAGPAEAQHIACYQPARLGPAMSARVTPVPSIPNRLRSDASFRNNVIGNIAAGATFTVLEGPLCSEGIHWYRVQSGALVGWTAEGNGYNSYWLEPYYPQPGPVPPSPAPCTLIPRLAPGQQGQVTPGLPNVIRNEPGTNATGAVNSHVIGEIPAGGVFDVYNGPQCGSDGRWWWQVNYMGIIGWTAEGEGSNRYWLAPYSFGPPQCPNALPPRLSLDQMGRVTSFSNLPNRLRLHASTSSPVLARMQPGESFMVLSGPFCSEAFTWWQVRYGDFIGWTAEGSSNSYWLEPLAGG